MQVWRQEDVLCKSVLSFRDGGPTDKAWPSWWWAISLARKMAAFMASMAVLEAWVCIYYTEFPCIGPGNLKLIMYSRLGQNPLQ